jgi:hypothetical protein
VVAPLPVALLFGITNAQPSQLRQRGSSVEGKASRGVRKRSIGEFQETEVELTTALLQRPLARGKFYTTGLGRPEIESLGSS